MRRSDQSNGGQGERAEVQDVLESYVREGAQQMLAAVLEEEVRDLFEGAQAFGFEGAPHDYARTVNKNHGRLETRQCWVITDPGCLDYIQTRQQWAKLNAVVKVTARREIATETSVHSRYYISSLAGQAKTLLSATRPDRSGEHRKQPALVARCHLSRRPQPSP